MRGQKVPSFIRIMNFKEQVAQLLEEALHKNKHLFLIQLTINEANKIAIVLDGDTGVTLEDCVTISRAIEHNLDREIHDFSLEVSSAGVGTPLQIPRQYKKNIGKVLKIKTASLQIEALLENVNEDQIKLSWITREPKKIGKGKENVKHELEIPYSDIIEAIVTITF